MVIPVGVFIQALTMFLSSTTRSLSVAHFKRGFFFLFFSFQDIPNLCIGITHFLCNGSDSFSLFSQLSNVLFMSHRQLSSGLHVGSSFLTSNAVGNTKG